MKTVQFDEMTRAKMSRSELLRKSMGASALGVAALAIPNLSSAQDADPDSEQIAELYEFYAAVGLANSYGGDPDLNARLWADDATFTRPNGATLIGKAAILDFLVHNAVGLTHDTLMLSALFKVEFDVHGDTADFTFVHFFVDRATQAVVGSTHATGTLKKVRGTWLFWHVAVGPASSN